jgi:hypothetical protein
MTTLRHRCASCHLRADRMLLASLDQHEDGLALVVAELGDCVYCWKNLAMHLVCTLANDRALNAGGLSIAADFALRGVARYLMPGEIPDPEVGEDAGTAAAVAPPAHGLLHRILHRCRHPRKRAP